MYRPLGVFAAFTVLLFGALALAPGASASTQLLVLTLNNSLSPSAARLLNGTSSSVTATAVTGSRSTNVTALVHNWSSSSPAVATIDSTGHVHALSPGTTTISASIVGGVKGSTSLAVTSVQPPAFLIQPGNTPVSAVITPGVQTQVQDNLGDLLAGFNVSMSIGTNAAVGGTGTLSGTLAHTTNASGVATFSDLKIDWVGDGYTLVATASTPTTPVSAVSAAFDETRVGDACLGPNPACSSGCADSDDDGLNDAWEIAGGIDINGDGIIDAEHDVLLPGADPNKPDVYLKYDYMVASTTNPFGDPPHSHQPSGAAIQQVVDSFAAHGITLHIDALHDAIPEAFVTTLDPNPTLACAANGISGGGYNFVTMHTLRQQYFGNRKWAYHYAVFAHSHTVPDTAPCCDGTCGTQPCYFSCPTDSLCGGKPDPTSSGIAELPGSSFIVASGTLADNNGIDPGAIGVESQASIFMHELGHNFGLVHGSLAPSLDPVLTNRQQACLPYKPNYLSVMDYSYFQNGISVATQPGSATPLQCNADSDCPAGSHCTDDVAPPGSGGNVCYRVDYSNENLLTLNEASLDETLGVGGATGDADIVSYCSNHACGLLGPSYGPIDWNGDGAIETSVQVDIDAFPISNTPNRVLSTTSDWDKMNFKFQCTSAFASDAAGGASFAQVQSSITGPELGLKEARERHILYPPMSVEIVISPGCADKEISASTVAKAAIALLGSERFDVNQVDVSSLRFHGARPVTVSVVDVNHDGIPDLLLEFPGADVRLSPQATRARLTGWLKNSRAFVGEDAVKVVPATQALSCQASPSPVR